MYTGDRAGEKLEDMRERGVVPLDPVADRLLFTGALLVFLPAIFQSATSSLATISLQSTIPDLLGTMVTALMLPALFVILLASLLLTLLVMLRTRFFLGGNLIEGRPVRLLLQRIYAPRAAWLSLGSLLFLLAPALFVAVNTLFVLGEVLQVDSATAASLLMRQFQLFFYAQGLVLILMGIFSTLVAKRVFLSRAMRYFGER